MPDAHKSGWQDMGSKPPEEFHTTERSLFLFATFPVVFVFEAYRMIINLQQTVVGDGNFMGVSSQILNHHFGRSKWPLGINDPFLFERLLTNVLGYVHLFPELGHKPCPEHHTHSPFWKKVLVFVFGHLPLIRLGYPTTRHDAVHMRMQPELLSPSVKDGDHAGFGSQIFRVCCKRLDSGPRGRKQSGVNRLVV